MLDSASSFSRAKTQERKPKALFVALGKRCQLGLAKPTSTGTTSSSSQRMIGALRLSLASQQEPFPSDSKKPRGAVAVLIKEEAENLWLLMIKRAANPRDPWSGQMAFPGGHADPADRSLMHTAARETLEEVAINVGEQEFLGCLRNLEPRNVPMLVAPFVFLLSRTVHPSESAEAREIIWVPMSFLLEPKNVSSLTVPIGGREISMGCYVYLDHTIWGLSFRIIRDIVSKIAGA
jgi:8-oxo-dGTP pyrophosphatase MutT (NUDIX family)